MTTFIAIFHIIVAALLIFFVLIQDSKGSSGALFGGGGSGSLFGATGAANVIAKLTRYIAIIFAGTCLYLSWYSANQSQSVLAGYVAPAVKVSPTPTATPSVPPETASEKAETQAPPAAAPAAPAPTEQAAPKTEDKKGK